MRVYLFFVCVLISTAIIVDNSPLSWSATDHQLNNRILNLNGYATILITNSTFTNVIAYISNSSTLIVTNSNFIGKYNISVSQIVLETISSASFTNNTFRGVTIFNNTCITMNTEILLIARGIYENVTLDSNRFEYVDQYPSLPFTIVGNLSALGTHQFTSNRISVQTSNQDIFSWYSNVTKCTNATTYRLETLLGATNTNESMFGIAGSSIVSLSIANNIALFYTGNTTKEQHSVTNWFYDSMFHIRGFKSSSIMSYTNNTMQLWHQNGTRLGLDTPVRVQRLITNMTTSAIKASFGLSGLYPPRYQYVASALISQNNAPSGAYTHDIQMEPDYSDEYEGYNVCHYACRHNCTSCLFVDEIQHPIEFSQYTHGICFQRQVFSKLIYAARLCAHEQTYFATPYRSNDALIISSKNKWNGKSEWLAREPGGLIVIAMNNTIISLPEYRAILDPIRYASDPTENFWNFYKPHLIIPREYWNPRNSSAPISNGENANMTELKFNGVRFEVQNDVTCNFLFSTNLGGYTLYGTQQLSSLELIDSPVVGFSPTGGYLSSGHLIRTLSNNVGWGNILSSISTLTIRNATTFSWMGPLIDQASSVNITNLNLIQINFDHMGNGLYDSTGNNALSTVTLDTINATYSYLTSDGRFLKLLGTNRPSTLSISGFQIILPFTTDPDATLSSRFFEFGYWDVSDLDEIVTDGKAGVGLQFYNLTQYPCNFFTFVALGNRNPKLLGNVRDYMCSPEEIFCKGMG